ncbi:hypothetical protein C8R47DRAFT_1215578 [Mycena vitilis]|nr:hypothetical protein C8R47DRAFT_1215578 [Mycena vitilis]
MHAAEAMEPSTTTASTPRWPNTISDFQELASFLKGAGAETFATASYRCHFFQPRYGSYAQDESAYTADDEREPYRFLIFGRVRKPEPENGHRHTFFLEGSDDLPDDLKKLFMEQTEVLMEPVLEDDLMRRDEQVEVCTDGDRITGKGGTYIEVFYSDSTLHCQGGDSEQLYTDWRAEHPLVVGDWVLLEGTYHRQENYLSGGPIQYFIQASHVRVLDMKAARAAEAPILLGTAPFSLMRRQRTGDELVGTGVPSTESGVIPDAPEVTVSEKNLCSSTPKGRKRSRSTAEANAAPRRSPRKKVREEREHREALGDITPLKHQRAKKAGRS